MTAKSKVRHYTFDAFLSHASSDMKFAARIDRSLRDNGLEPWIDNSSLAYGSLLRDELQSAIGNSRVLVLLWSRRASQSRWVMAEIFTAFHLDRFIIPCVLDTTRLPQFLERAAYLNRESEDIGEKLFRVINAAPPCANKVAPWLGSRTPLLESLIREINATQIDAVQNMTEDFQQAKKANLSAARALKNAKAINPFDPQILNLAGYQCKNEYMFKHWEKIQAGRGPKDDDRLLKGERNFFDALCVDPSNPSALNGLGSILMLERELDAAEFFVRRAIDIVKRGKGNYAAAQHDLDLILYFKRRPAY